MDTPEDYYGVLGVPFNADYDTVKRAYRQLARRYHPDLAGPGGAIEMKRINRAYAVLGDPEKREQYDMILSGVIDQRRSSSRPRQRPHTPDNPEDVEFSGLNMFSTHGPFHSGGVINSHIGVISALAAIRTSYGTMIAAGTLDGNGTIWQVITGDGQSGKITDVVNFASDPTLTIESIRELRFSVAGSLLTGWGRLGLHTWDAFTGKRLWSYAVVDRAVSTYYSLDTSLHTSSSGPRSITLALPYLADGSVRAWGVRSTDIVHHDIDHPDGSFFDPLVCTEETIENRRFWAVRARILSEDAQTLVTLSCANVPDNDQQMAIIRRWNLEHRTMGNKKNPLISSSILVGRCEDCTSPYVMTPDASLFAFVHASNMIRICDTLNGTYSEIASGTMSSIARMAISADGQWLAVAREDSEVNEGVIDLWSIPTGQIMQKFYHPWQISALVFTEKQLVVALTDGTIKIWQA
jgi:hypothetical protein